MKIKEYDLKKSAKRLIWRFNLKNGFTPNTDDKNALNCVLEWINREKEDRLKDNILFAKLFIYILNQNIRYYETDVLEKEPQKHLSKILDTPIELFYEAFNRELENVQLNRMLERVKKENDTNFTKDELKQYFDKTFQKEELNHMITEALNRFN